MPKVRFQRGVIPLAVLGVGFLVASLVAITSITNNPLRNIGLTSWAKAQKTWRDVGNPKARHAGKVAEENAKQEAYKTDAALLTNVDKASLSATDQQKLAALQAKHTNQQLLTATDFQSAVNLQNTAQANAKAEIAAAQASERLAANQKVEEGGTGQAGVKTTDTTFSTVQKTDEGFARSQTTVTRDSSGKIVATKTVEVPPSLGATPLDISTFTPAQLTAYTNAQRRELQNTTLTNTETSYTSQKNAYGYNDLIKTDTITTRNLANGSVTDIQTVRTILPETKSNPSPGTTSQEFAYVTKTEETVTPSSPTVAGRRTDTYVKRNEQGIITDTWVERYNIDPTTGKEKYDPLSSAAINVWNKIFPPNTATTAEQRAQNDAAAIPSATEAEQRAQNDTAAISSALVAEQRAQNDTAAINSFSGPPSGTSLKSHDAPAFNLFDGSTWNRVTNPEGKAYNGVSCSGGDSCASGYCGGGKKCEDPNTATTAEQRAQNDTAAIPSATEAEQRAQNDTAAIPSALVAEQRAQNDAAAQPSTPTQPASSGIFSGVRDWFAGLGAGSSNTPDKTGHAVGDVWYTKTDGGTVIKNTQYSTTVTHENASGVTATTTVGRDNTTTLFKDSGGNIVDQNVESNTAPEQALPITPGDVNKAAPVQPSPSIGQRISNWWAGITGGSNNTPDKTGHAVGDVWYTKSGSAYIKNTQTATSISQQNVSNSVNATTTVGRDNTTTILKDNNNQIVGQITEPNTTTPVQPNTAPAQQDGGMRQVQIPESVTQPQTSNPIENIYVTWNNFIQNPFQSFLDRAKLIFSDINFSTVQNPSTQ